MKRNNRFVLLASIIIFTMLSGCSSVTNKQLSSASINHRNIIALSAGTSYSFALTDQGEVYAWGDNSFGQLGTGNKQNDLFATKVNIPEPVEQIAAGPRGMALTRSGKLYTWGTNQYGEIGDGTNEDRLFPTQIQIPEKIVRIFRGSQGMALTENGSLYMWGWNMHGEVGNGTTEHVNTPYKLELGNKVIDAAAFGTHTLVLCENGSLYAWGSNYLGELGDGKAVVNSSQNSGELIENNTPIPKKVVIDKKVSAIAAGNGVSYALCEDGSLFAWGANDVGQLGIGNDNIKNTSIPMQVHIREKINKVVSGQFHALAETVDGDIYCWGYNQGKIGAVGLDSEANVISTPQKLLIDEGARAIYPGGGHTFILCNSGKIYGWGANEFGQLGMGNTEKQTKPVEIVLRSNDV